MASTYLTAYNLAQASGWTVSALTAARAAAAGAGVYAAAAPVVRACQAAALLETVHVLAGLVKGSAPLALLQWFGRSNVLFLILGAVPEVQKHAAVLPLFLAWSIADIIRYAWYAAGSRAPHWLTWLRYSAFVPLYPVGIFAGEMPIIRAAIPFIAKRGLWSIAMPNAWNYAFSYAAFCRVGLYFLLPAAFLHLYGTLLAARRRKLGGGGRKRD